LGRSEGGRRDEGKWERRGRGGGERMEEGQWREGAGDKKEADRR
jgi:hypothetical protein